MTFLVEEHTEFQTNIYLQTMKNGYNFQLLTFLNVSWA